MNKVFRNTLSAMLAALVTLLGFVGCRIPHPCEYGAPAPGYFLDDDTLGTQDSRVDIDSTEADSLR